MTTAYKDRIIYLTNTMFKGYEQLSSRKDTVFGLLKRVTTSFGRDAELSAEKRGESSHFLENVQLLQRSKGDSFTDSAFREAVKKEISEIHERLRAIYTKHQADRASLEKYLELYNKFLDSIYHDYEDFGLLDTPVETLEQDAYLMLVQAMTHYLVENELKTDPLYNEVFKLPYAGMIYDYMRNTDLSSDKASMIRIKIRSLRKALTGMYVNSESYNAEVLRTINEIDRANDELIKKHATVVEPQSALPGFLQFLTSRMPASASFQLKRDRGTLGHAIDEIRSKTEALRAQAPSPDAKPLAAPNPTAPSGQLLLTAPERDADAARVARPKEASSARVPILGLYSTKRSEALLNSPVASPRGSQEEGKEEAQVLAKDEPAIEAAPSEFEEMLAAYISKESTAGGKQGPRNTPF